MSDEQAAYNKGFSSRRLKDIGLVGAGTALGGGLGWLVGDKLATAVLGNPRSAMAVRIGLPIAGGLAAGYASSLELRRREIEQERAHQAGIEALTAHQTARDKVQKAGLPKEARILTGPQEWTESEKTTGKGAALGALGGLAVAGVSAVKPSYGAFAVPGAIAGALLARHSMRKRRQEQGYA